MPKYLLAVNFQPGVVDTPMEEWKPEEIDEVTYNKKANTTTKKVLEYNRECGGEIEKNVML